jgi:putative glutamine amidotransferase
MIATIQDRARVGVPYRTAKEETEGQHAKHDYYLRAVSDAGAEPVPISLRLVDAELAHLLGSLDAFVLPGSPADVAPSRYGASRHAKCGDADPARERVDWAVLVHAFSESKPLLAICYGIQSLNVFLGGTLVQDVPSEIPGALRHSKAGGNVLGEVASTPSEDPQHKILIEPSTRLAQLAALATPGICITLSPQATVNSSHHQAILTPGRGLKVSAKAPDGVIEAVEWIEESASGERNPSGIGARWITGVQWHPERLTHNPGADALSATLFRALALAASGVTPQAT